VPALRVMRRESAPPARILLSYLVGAAAFAGLLVWQAGDPKLGGYVAGGFAAAVLAFFAVAWAVLNLLTRPRVVRRFGQRLRYGLTNLRRHARGNAVQVASLAARAHRGAAAVVYAQRPHRGLAPQRPARRAEPVPARRAARPAEDVQAFFAAHKLASADLYPMVRGRLTAVNGKR
jgi:putative ABC transport system permease protein